MYKILTDKDIIFCKSFELEGNILFTTHTSGAYRTYIVNSDKIFVETHRS